MIAAGSTGSIPATAELLKTIAQLPTGAVVLPGLDTDLDGEAWNGLDAGHAQFGLRQLLAHLGVERADVAPWSPLPGDHDGPRGTRAIHLRSAASAAGDGCVARSDRECRGRRSRAR